MSDPVGGRSRGKGRTSVELAVSALVLVATLYFVGVGQLWARLHTLRPAWLLLGVCLTFVQFALLAGRWWFVALRVGVPLSYRRALAEYYLSTLLNYVAPFGLFGDAVRALRHAARASESARERPLARVLSAIVLERTSGQMALWLVVLGIAPDWWGIASPALCSHAWLVLPVGSAVVCALVALAWVGQKRGWLVLLRSVAATGARVLFLPANLIVHLGLSLTLLTAHIALFIVAAHALGLELAPGPAIRIVPLVLVASSVPAFVGGFGIREAAAAALYHLTGLSAADGAAIALIYGSVGLVASLPGLFALQWRRRHTSESKQG
ncbi:MAG TPA: lysylphosphatidylglycerol synthase transmembrane domain-containing protein [Polyangiaceae bacterium]